MAIATLDAYKQALQSARQKIAFRGIAGPTTQGPFDYFTRTRFSTLGDVGVAPTTAVVPTSATVGALGQQNPTAGQLSIAGGVIQTTAGSMWVLCDRLSHQGGLSGIVTTAQTTNLPTAALTRHTSGEGVMIGLSIYTQIGATGTTVSATYTNSGGVGSRVTPLVVFGGTNFRELGRMILLPLQAGDTGVRSVESVTVTATTGTAGDFGVVLFKPLAAFCASSPDCLPTDFVSGGFVGGLPSVVNDACLFFVRFCPAAAGAGAYGEVTLAEN